jgi:hypothetical protein
MKYENRDSIRGLDPLIGVWSVGATLCGRPYLRLPFGGAYLCSRRASIRHAPTISPIMRSGTEISYFLENACLISHVEVVPLLTIMNA